MTQTTFRVSMFITWIVTVGLAYLIGWWRGVSRAVGVATNTAGASLNIIWYVLIAVAIVSAIVAFRARSYLSRGGPSSPTV